MNAASFATLAWLWAGVVALGAFHGLNPAMGWPLAVARGLDRRQGRAVVAAWLPLGAGHLLAMVLVLMPFAFLSALMQWSREIRIGAGVVVLLFGAALLLPQARAIHRYRWLVRIRPSQLALWSFVMASVHGAGLMLVPVMIGLCDSSAGAAANDARQTLMQGSLGTAVLVSLVHTAAMVGAGLGLAWLVYGYLGLRALQRAWINLDRVWAMGLMAAGAAAVAMG